VPPLCPHCAPTVLPQVTRRNPWPIKLQFEKIYHPGVLITKKRYAGFMYESPCQLVPEFDAKGIETVRRDGCLAGAKTLEKVCSQHRCHATAD